MSVIATAAARRASSRARCRARRRRRRARRARPSTCPCRTRRRARARRGVAPTHRQRARATSAGGDTDGRAGRLADVGRGERVVRASSSRNASFHVRNRVCTARPGPAPSPEPSGEQAEGEPRVEVVGVDRHVARVGAHRGPGAPQQVAADPPLERDEVDAEVGARATAARPAPRSSASAGIRKSRCGVGGSSSVCQSRSVGGRSSAGVGDVVPCSHA